MNLDASDENEFANRIKSVQNIFIFKQSSEPSLELMAYFFSRLNKFSDQLPHFSLVLDLTETGRLSPEIREYIKVEISRYKNLERISVVFLPKRLPLGLIKFVTRFIVSKMNLKEIRYDESVEEAIRYFKSNGY